MNYKYDEFLEFTPCEFKFKIEKYISELNRKQEDEIANMKTQAWLNANLIRSAIASVFNEKAKFPELRDILGNREPQTPEQMEEAMRTICLAFGGQIVEIEG